MANCTTTISRDDSIAELERFGLSVFARNEIEKMGIVFIRDLIDPKYNRLSWLVRRPGFAAARRRNLNESLLNYFNGREVKTAHECTYTEDGEDE